MFFLGAVWVTEKILAWKTQSYQSGITRVIRLREVQPLFSGKFAPTDDEMGMSDTLVRKGYRVRTDADGFIMPSRIHDCPDLTLVFLGGSTTACYYVDEEYRFPYLAGRLLEEDAKLKVNSYNSGVGGNYSLHSLDILLNKVIPMKPDAVVMMHNINDLTVLMFAGSYWSKDFKKGNTGPIVELNKKIIDFRLFIDRYFPHLYNVLKELEKNIRRKLRPKKAAEQDDELRDIRGRKIVLDKEKLVKEFTMNQQLFINICKARNITPVLMTMANRLKDKPDPLIVRLTSGLKKDHGITYQEYQEIFNLFNRAIRRTAAANQVLLIDLASAVPQEREYIYDVVHFTNQGSRLAAAVIKEALKSYLLAQKAKPPHLPVTPDQQK
jgi:lysophospholipase L1-like esterase